MVNKTKREIARATQQLLKEKPINKITIKEITQKCELTRNAFYYHFSDIYDVVNFIFENEVDNLLDEFMDENNFEGGFQKGISFLYENRDMMKHIYKTHQYESVNRCMEKIMYKVIMKMIDSIDVEGKYSQDVRKVTALFYRSSFVGVMQQWLTNDTLMPPEVIAVLCDDIFVGTVIPSLEASEKAISGLGVNII